MIRFAVFCTILTLVASSLLPKWRAKFTEPFFQTCLQSVPTVRYKTEIQSLVCGKTLQFSQHHESGTTSIIESWRNLGLIHILVVSGGHLSILATLLGALTGIKALSNTRIKRSASFIITASTLILFCFANRLQPPVLRAMFEWMTKKSLTRRGWRSPEIALMCTWLALPWSQSIYDLLSLALAFFASVTVSETSHALHRHRWLSLVALQIAVWWILLPLLFTLGVPHPLSTMVNVVLAPLLGATLIPLAMAACFSGLFPNWVSPGDPLGIGVLFDYVWEKVSWGVKSLAATLPDASPRIQGTRPLVFGLEMTSVLLIAILTASAALLIRTQRERRREGLKSSRMIRVTFVSGAVLLAILVHRQLS